MTGTQKYLFDLQGFLVVEDVLTDQECETAKRKIRERMQPLAKTPDGYDANGTGTLPGDSSTRVNRSPR